MKFEARAASGAVTEVPVGLMAVPNCMLFGSGILGAVLLVGAVLSIRWGGWLGWSLGTVAAILAVAGIGFLAFGLWGRYAGYPWGFGG